MCLVVQDINEQLPKELVPMKAKKDIVVYKMLEYACLPYSGKKTYYTPFMQHHVKFNLFGRCVMKSHKMTGKYSITPSLRDYLSHGTVAEHIQNIEWVNGENISNVMRPNDTGSNSKETLSISEGIHAYTKILPKRFSQCFIRLDYRELHKAIIPKSSYYFVDEVNDEIVADKMIILKRRIINDI